MLIRLAMCEQKLFTDINYPKAPDTQAQFMTELSTNAQALTSDPTLFRAAHEGKKVEDDQVAFNIAVRILKLWGFTDAEKALILGDIPVATFRRMKNGNMRNKLTTDRRTRVSLILGIHKALRILLHQDEHRLEWLNKPNRAFRENSPKAIMLSGNLLGLYEIRRYLDTQTG